MLKKKNKSVEKTEKTEKKSVAVASDKLNFVEIFGIENHGGWVFTFILALVILAVILTAIAVVGQIQNFRRDSQRLNDLQKAFQTLQIENQRMLIEQQTFSATPQIMKRSADELSMFYPEFNNRMIIEINPSAVVHSAVASVPAVASGVSQ